MVRPGGSGTKDAWAGGKTAGPPEGSPCGGGDHGNGRRGHAGGLVGRPRRCFDHRDVPTTAAAPASLESQIGAPSAGYWLAAGDGGIFSFGNAKFYGSTGGRRLNSPVVGMAATPDGGRLLDGGRRRGHLRLRRRRVLRLDRRHPPQPAGGGHGATPDGKGYWLVAADGGIFSFGDAKFYGSTGNIAPQPAGGGDGRRPPTGSGYWLVAADGGIFTFGDAKFYGSTGGMRSTSRWWGWPPTPDGGGYWLVAADGGIFGFGDAQFHGSTGCTAPQLAGRGDGPDPRRWGYWLVAADGGIFSLRRRRLRGIDGRHTPRFAGGGDDADGGRPAATSTPPSPPACWPSRRSHRPAA